ncbi:major facilitator superfamily transporter [Colletotrichum karsti]|uniref:Major facilitator superfamily transporter n=1 Tax=Colletotrichum karsti TaxID=1095194 RepID=A0A9P6LLV3_9PEZI|nr:major facilitator superfamily transporter [Colletotrichum karsti]KAF9877635.1 major facilitator superfamily transporter [Colletotrichum karsti]
MPFFDYVRDTLAWQFVRLATGGKLPEFQHFDERHPLIKQRYANGGASRRPGREQEISESKDAYVNRLPALKRHQSENRARPTRDPYVRGHSFDDVEPRLPNSHWSNETVDMSELEKYTSHSTSNLHGLHLVHFLPDDPEDPKNWCSLKKTIVSIQICLLIACTYAGASIYTVGLHGVREQFGVTEDVALLGLTTYVIGYGVGPMVWSPLAEVPQIGRNPLYILSLIVFIVVQVPIALATNIGMLLAFRFMAGFFGAPVLGTGGGILTDMYASRKHTYAMGLWALIGIGGPTVGPIIGGFAVEAEGWKWTAWITAWAGTTTLALMIFFLPETSADNILYRRSLRLRRATGDRRYICEAEIKAENTTGKEVLLTHLVRPFTMVMTEPVVFLLLLYSSFIYGLMYIWFEALPLAYEEVYHFDLGTRSITLLGLIVGVLLIIPPFFLYYRKRIEPQFDHLGNIQPEKLLIPAMMGCLFPPASLVWFGFTAKPTVHWAVPIVGSSLFTSGALLLFISFMNYLGESFPDHVSSIFAGHEVFTSLCGGTFPLFVPLLYYKLGIFGSSILMAIFAMALVPIPFILYLNGARLRKHSRHDRREL